MTSHPSGQRSAGMRVIHVVSGLEKDAGGPSYSVPRLVEGLKDQQVDVRIFSDRDEAEQAEINGDIVDFFDRDFSAVPILNKLHFSRGLSRALMGNEQPISLIHSHGLWRMPNIYAAKAARLRNATPLVVSPRGMLGPAALTFSKRQKKLFWLLAQRSALQSSACFHATSEQECEEIRSLGFVAPIAVIPNGVDLPSPALVDHIERDPRAPRTLLFLSRLHGKKNVEGLLTAWGSLQAEYPDWKLDIVGSGDPKYEAKLRDKVRATGLSRVSFHGPRYGAEKWSRFRGADLFVLPTLNENFGIAVAESLACGTPAIVSKGAPWSELDARGCGWWIDHGDEALVAALRHAMKMPKHHLNEMGIRGTQWVQQDFSWDAVAMQMAEVYRWLVGRAERPETVFVR
jgi:glycosyltransferase involved in cell wall biosynthesis